MVVITVPLAISNKNADVQSRLVSLYKTIPKNAVLISSNLIRPQVSFYGETYFINEPGQNSQFIKSKIDTALLHKRPVYIDSQALYNPYFSLDGNNLHTLSLGNVGKSEVSRIFKEYSVQIVKTVDVRRRIYLYEINPDNTLKNKRKNAKPGEEIFFYSKNPIERINPMRVDYYDLGTWAWTVIINKNEPILWTIADKNGEYTIPGY